MTKRRRNHGETSDPSAIDAGRQRSWRRIAGTVLFDWPRYWRCLASPGGWSGMRNRQDVLIRSPEGAGLQCAWEHTRPLHLCEVFPRAGRGLLRAALRQCPIRFADAPGRIVPETGKAEVSFIIGHRGVERLPHLLLTLRTLAAQQHVRLECIVVEQDADPAVRDHLPDWVRYLHRPPAGSDRLFSRSAAFNAGASVARGEVLVLHDNDLLVPSGYAAEAVRLAAAGSEVINHKRFIFYLSEEATAGCFAGGQTPPRLASMVPEQVLENATSGGSLAVTRATYDALGGMDESFEGWGGEDVEFWQRAMTRRVWNFGSFPLVHLWHSPQPGKYPKKRTPGMERLRQLSAIPPEQRIRALREAGRGREGRL